MEKYLIAIDEGTTSTRAMLYSLKENRFVENVSRPIKQFYPEPNWVEEDAEEIFSETLFCLNKMIEKVGNPSFVLGIGVTNQRETVIAWDKVTGKPICNAIVWQCRRTADFCKNISPKTLDVIREKTGLINDAYFSASKIKWILDNVPKAKELLSNDRLMVGTVDSYLIFRLTGEFATDYTNASRTMLFNIHTLKWDSELLEYFGIPESILPKVKSSTSIFGEYDYRGVKIKVAGNLGDQHASLFGQNCVNVGESKITYGTGMFMLFNTGKKPAKSTCNMLTTIGYSVGEDITYALEGSVFNAGSAVQWLRDGLNLFEKSFETEKMATSVEDNGGVYIVPAFTGLGAPYWKSDATGLITGITRATNKNHIVRAVLESMAYSAKVLAEDMQKDSGVILKEIRADGGASENDFLMQFQSDVLGVKINRPLETESTALGAIYATGIALGELSIEKISQLRKTDKIFVPSPDREKFQKLYEGYCRAVERCLL